MKRLMRAHILQLLWNAWEEGATSELLWLGLSDAGYSVSRSEVEELLHYLAGSGKEYCKVKPKVRPSVGVWWTITPHGVDLLEHTIAPDPGVSPRPVARLNSRIPLSEVHPEMRAQTHNPRRPTMLFCSYINVPGAKCRSASGHITNWCVLFVADRDMRELVEFSVEPLADCSDEVEARSEVFGTRSDWVDSIRSRINANLPDIGGDFTRRSAVVQEVRSAFGVQMQSTKRRASIIRPVFEDKTVWHDGDHHSLDSRSGEAERRDAWAILLRERELKRRARDLRREPHDPVADYVAEVLSQAFGPAVVVRVIGHGRAARRCKKVPR